MGEDLPHPFFALAHALFGAATVRTLTGAFERRQQMIRLDRFDQVVVALLPHRTNCAVDRCVAGENHNLREGRERMQPRHDLDSIHFGQTQVDQRDRR